MGASCLLFALPIIGFALACSQGKMNSNSKIILALIICLFQFNTAFFSFTGDYWYAKTAYEPQSEIGESTEKETNGARVVWWRKMMIMNRIDVSTATTTCI